MVRLFRVFVPTSVVALLFSEAVLILSCYTLACFFVLASDPVVFLLYQRGFLRVALVVGCEMLGIYLHDLYTEFRTASRILLVQQLCLVIGVAFLSQALLSYLKHPDWTLPKWIMIAGSALVIVLLPVWRILYGSVVLKAVGAERLLFVGSSPSMRELSSYLVDHPEIGFAAMGYVDTGDEPGGADHVQSLGCICDLEHIVSEVRPDRVIIAAAERRGRLPLDQLLDLRFSGIRIEDLQTTYEAAFGRLCVSALQPSQLIFSTELGPRPNALLWQSIYSFIIAIAATALSAPIMILVALSVRLSSAGPIFYRQTRVGRNGVPFMLFKFRSMYANAEAKTGPVWAQKNDPRITPIGRWLRRLRLDELPQLFNVVRGEMAIVGPRPERPEFVKVLAEQIPYYRQRHCVKPGITGWAQINHKYGDSIEDTIRKLEFDLFYIKNLAPSLDAYIMFQTLKVMLLTRGAQ